MHTVGVWLEWEQYMYCYFKAWNIHTPLNLANLNHTSKLLNLMVMKMLIDYVLQNVQYCKKLIFNGHQYVNEWNISGFTVFVIKLNGPWTLCLEGLVHYSHCYMLVSYTQHIHSHTFLGGSLCSLKVCSEWLHPREHTHLCTTVCSASSWPSIFQPSPWSYQCHIHKWCASWATQLHS